MREYIRSFINQCLHCLSCKGPLRIPRPLSEAIHADQPNTVLHFDYLFISQQGERASHDFRYVLVLMDDHSTFVRLAPSAQASTEQVVESILRWGSAFGFSRVWVSDRGTHFKNLCVSQLSDHLRVRQHLTMAGMHFPNGTVERACQVAQEVLRLLVQDFQIVDNRVLNHTPRRNIANFAPITVFTGLQPESPLDSLLDAYAAPGGCPVDSSVLLARIVRLQDSLEVMRKKVSASRNELRERSRATQFAHPSNFAEGDFVLFDALDDSTRTRRSKLFVRWTGPYRVVTALSDWHYRIEGM